MKLCKIYSNNDDQFHNIELHDGLNVILAEITDKSKTDKDTHNLGKTLLISLIDFLLLKQINDKSKFFLTKGGFENQVFFAELKLNNGKYLIIRRSVNHPSKISFRVSAHKTIGFETEIIYDYENISFEAAQKKLNDYLGFNVLQKWPYRKSVTYFLRSQHDFRDVFRLDKFNKGKDRDWKPFMFDLLGFNSEVIEDKYKLEDEIDELSKKVAILRKENDIDINERDKVAGLLSIKKDEKEDISTKIDKFNFFENDEKINTELVENLDVKIQILNTERYGFSVDIKKIEDSLSVPQSTIDLDKLKRLYSDVNIYFPDKLANDYANLLQFKDSITKERNRFLQENLTKFLSKYDELSLELKSLESKKEKLLEYLTEKDSYFKFKELQKQLSSIEANLIQLQEKLDSIDKTTVFAKEIEEKQCEVENKSKEIQSLIDEQKHAEIRKIFNHIIKEILNVNALISLKLNKMGNVEFEATIQNPESLVITDEDDGSTYRKMLCIAFDLSILIYYANSSFYRFVYHDGSLEALDNRKKIRYISTIKRICAEYNLQYIFSVIDSDLPRDEYGHVIQFQENEICLKLHDRDDSGKLFKKSF